MAVPQKNGIDLPQYPTIPFLSIFPKDTPFYHKDTCSTMFTVALFIIARDWKQHRCPSIKEWIRKETHLYSAVKKKNDIMKFAGKWVDTRCLPHRTGLELDTGHKAGAL
jgi:hypothetical protein